MREVATQARDSGHEFKMWPRTRKGWTEKGLFDAGRLERMGKKQEVRSNNRET